MNLIPIPQGAPVGYPTIQHVQAQPGHTVFVQQPMQRTVVQQAVPAMQQVQQQLVLMPSMPQAPPMQVVTMQPSAPQPTYVQNALFMPQPATVWVQSTQAAAEESDVQEIETESAPGGEVIDAQSPVLSVPGKAPLQSVADAIVMRVQEQSTLIVEATGLQSVALCMRSFIVAQIALQAEQASFTVTPVFHAPAAQAKKTSHPPPITLRFLLTKRAIFDGCTQRVMSTMIKVTNASKVAKVAGALARVMRAHYRSDRAFLHNAGAVTTISLGTTPTTIYSATKALALAREMLEKDARDFQIIPIIHQDDHNVEVVADSPHPLLYTIERCEKRSHDLCHG